MDEREWQRRYDESVDREAAANAAAESTSAEQAVIEAGGCLPGWAGAIVIALTAAIALIRRAIRRSRGRSPSAERRW